MLILWKHIIAIKRFLSCHRERFQAKSTSLHRKTILRREISENLFLHLTQSLFLFHFACKIIKSHKILKRKRKPHRNRAEVKKILVWSFYVSRVLYGAIFSAFVCDKFSMRGGAQQENFKWFPIKMVCMTGTDGLRFHSHSVDSASSYRLNATCRTFINL